MALTKLEEWSETAASNIDVGGIVLSDSTQIDQLDNIEREQMAQIAKWLGDDTLASASTTDLGSVPGRYVSVTGTTTITGLGTIKAGTVKYIKFSGALTFTHNATSLILPGAANITTAAGDTAIMVSEGSGNWRCVSYQRASGSRVELSTAQTLSSSGVTFTGIPPWARRVRIMIVGASLSGTANIFIRLGDSGGVENTGYTGQIVQINSAPSVSAATFASGFQLTIGTDPSYAWEGTVVFDLIDASINRWSVSGSVGTTADARINIVTGYKALSGPLDRIQILQNAADTFDSGQVNISWE